MVTRVLSFAPSVVTGNDFIPDASDITYVEVAKLFTEETCQQKALEVHHFDVVIMPSDDLEEHRGVAVFFYALRFLKDEASIVWVHEPSWYPYISKMIEVNGGAVFQTVSSLFECKMVKYTRPNMCFMTMILGDVYKTKVAIGTQSKAEYAKAAGYPLEAVETMPEGLDLEGRPMSWARILLFKHYLEKYEYIFYVDGDTILLNDTFAPEMMLALMKHDQHTLLLGRDHNAENCGVMLVRRSPELIDLLDRMWACTYCINHIWWENKAFVDLYAKDEQVRNIVRVIPKNHCNLINAYVSNYKKNWLIHFAGVRNDLTGQMTRHYKQKRQDVRFSIDMFKSYIECVKELN